MIKANELRINNFVTRKSNPDVFCTVNWGIIKDISLSANTDYAPIPLTPEILDKCGFVPVNAGSTFWSAFMESENNYFISAEYHSNGDLNIRDLMDSRFAVKNILYLHQLQNLIYSLTGEELTIKL